MSPEVIIAVLLLPGIVFANNSTPAKINDGVVDKREFIKTMMKDAWYAYRKYAWGEYAVHPVAGATRWNRGGPQAETLGGANRGTSIIDAMDTLYIMGLLPEFEQAREWVMKSFKPSTVNAYIEIDEAVPEIVAGLLSAYFLTSDQVFLDRAAEVASLYLMSFNTGTGLPYRGLIWVTKKITTNDPHTYLYDLGALQQEFYVLSELTGNPEFKARADKVKRFLMCNTTKTTEGLYPDNFSVRDGKPYNGKINIRFQADFILSLVNAWTRRNDTQSRYMFISILRSYMQHMVTDRTTVSGYRFITETDNGKRAVDVMRTEACMSAGVYALAASKLHPSNISVELMQIATEIAFTCHQVSLKTPSGLMPERFTTNEDLEIPVESGNNLSPAMAYSCFILYRLTGDPKYREWGWQLAQALQNHAKIGPNGGYTTIGNVMRIPTRKEDNQPTYFMGATLKYLYLLFCEPDFYSLDHWIFSGYYGHLMPIDIVKYSSSASVLPPWAYVATAFFVCFNCLSLFFYQFSL